MIVKPVSRIIQELDASSFTVLGSPGSEGQGMEALQIFARGLAGAEGDFIVVLGDVSPLGRDPYYKYIVEFIDRSVGKPVYVMPGNHDGPDYEKYFGCSNCAVVSDTFSLIMLDNSRRRFSDESLEFLRDTLAIVESPNIVVAFHVPPPNRFTGDSLSEAEWARFEEAAGVWRKRISLLMAGHARSYFEDEVDGLRLIVTGGGGARIQELERVVTPPHHALEYRVGANDVAAAKIRNLDAGDNGKRESEITAGLTEAFTAESRNFLDHSLDAEEAERNGLPNLARLYRAAAESCLQHARIIRRVLKNGYGPRAAVTGSLEVIRSRDDDGIKDRIAAADMAGDFLAAHAIAGAVNAETAIAALFDKAAVMVEDGVDLAAAPYYICHSCGRLSTGGGAPAHCTQCGAPGDRIHETQ